VVGEIRYDGKKRAIERFDVAGVGRAWGNKMNYVHREIRLDQYPWMYGIAWELVTGDTPQDRIPPSNLLPYNSTGPYFGTRSRRVPLFRLTLCRRLPWCSSTGVVRANHDLELPQGPHLSNHHSVGSARGSLFKGPVRNPGSRGL
jgi:hypothetical protein